MPRPIRTTGYACLAIFTAMVLALPWSMFDTHAFSHTILDRPSKSQFSPSIRINSPLSVGSGVATTYSWTEEQFEIELKVAVPARTSAKDIKFTCSSDSIHLVLLRNDTDDKQILLDGARKMRGKISVDGTFWSIDNNADEREVTITIEKHFVPISSVGGTQTYDTLTDFDWGGVYPNDEEEVTNRKYDEPEELNVREYAAKLGVNIDNIDMTKVNKTMFGAGLRDDSPFSEEEIDNDNSDGFRFNITQSTLDQLSKAGLAKEIIQQGDGSEFEVGNGGSMNIEERKTFSMLGKDISDNELRMAGIIGGGGRRGNNNIPSMWDKQTIPVEEAPGYQKTFDVGNSFSVADGIIEDEIVDHEITLNGCVENIIPKAENGVEVGVNEASEANVEKTEESNGASSIPQDPIDMLTVVRLKEILREQGLKTNGSKQILRDRLRSHVNSLLQEE
ncbi:hypothetical protein ACHAXH_009991 [Discostella pseudostelligera]